MTKPHKHAVLIKAWADGAQIQCLYGGEWLDVYPQWLEHSEYRVKPADIVRAYSVHRDGIIAAHPTDRPNLRLTFDYETGKLKEAEVFKQ